VDAILLTGGSAYGLGAADGVMRFLSDRNQGYPTSAGPVPIVPAAVIYDLDVGEPAWPTHDDGYAACMYAGPLDQAEFGAIGAGTGATYRKLWPGVERLPGGIGRITRAMDGVTVSAIAVVNAVGDVLTSVYPDRRADLLAQAIDPGERKSTSLVMVIIDGDCDERTLRRVAIAAHDGMARAIVPCHTIWDGDLVFAAQTGETREIEPTQSMRIAIAAELAVEGSIRNAVGRQAS
jgi:L-aminopeptidase/D-esterase-like protein